VSFDAPTNKVLSAKLFLAGYWNRPQVWPSPDVVPAAMRDQEFGIRYLVPSGPFRGHMNYQELLKEWNARLPVFKDLMYVCGAAPDDSRVIQGELTQCPGGYYFHGSTGKTTVREAMLDGSAFDWSGFTPAAALRQEMTPESWQDIQEIFDLWPDAIIEFTVFSKCFGHKPNRNTVIWEVRVGY